MFKEIMRSKFSDEKNTDHTLPGSLNSSMSKVSSLFTFIFNFFKVFKNIGLFKKEKQKDFRYIYLFKIAIRLTKSKL